jgi:AraC family transcriptional regulator
MTNVVSLQIANRGQRLQPPPGGMDMEFGLRAEIAGHRWSRGGQAPSFQDHDTAGGAGRALRISPADAITRHGVGWDGVAMEIVQAATHDKVEWSFNGRCHLLLVHEEGLRRQGETVVGDLPTSTLRDLRRKLTFVPAGCQYREWHEPEVRSRIICFYIDPARMPTDDGTTPADEALAPRLLFEDNTLWENAVKLAALVEDGCGNDRYCEALGVVVANEVVRRNRGARGARTPARGGLAPRAQRVAAAYIEGHLAERIALGSLAELVQLSPSHFSHAFKQSFGVSPLRYHNDRRIERAKRLLTDPAQSITDIGLQLGFSDTSAFCTAFRKATGSTPTAYRRRLS